MKINTSYLLALMSLGFVKSDVTYNVVAFPNEYSGSQVGLVVDGNTIPMTSMFEGSLWSVNATVPTHDFHFSILNNSGKVIKEESLNREWKTKDNKNESENYVFGKLNNNLDDNTITKIPRAFDRLQNEDKFSKLYQEGEVKIINIIADRTVLSNLHSSTSLAKVNANSDTTVEMYIISSENIKHFTNVTLSFSGMGSRGHAKRPYKIKLSDGDNDVKENKSVNGRKSFKLRNLVYDCTYVKQKIITDVGSSMGIILPQVSFARLYMNGEPYGLYELTDNPKKSWIKKIIHMGNLPENAEIGSYYKGVSYADEDENGKEIFVPATLREETDNLLATLYECENETSGQAQYTDLKTFTKWASSLSNNTTEEEIRKFFEVDMFIKYMILEYLGGHWDGYWIGGNNFYLYKNPTTQKYLFFSFDFDLTMGMWDPYTPETGYDTWGTSKKSTIPPLLVKRIIYHPVFKKLFDEYLSTTVKKVFNLNALGPRLDYFKDFLYTDIAWDRSVKPKAVALSDSIQFTLEDSMNAYEKADCQSDYGLKEWISGRSNYVAKLYNFSIPTNLDFSKGSVGDKIVSDKDKEDEVVLSKTNSSIVANSDSSSSQSLTPFSHTQFIIYTIVVILISKMSSFI